MDTTNHNEQPEVQPVERPSLKSMLAAEIREVAEAGMYLSNQIKTAKTSAKRNYYKKKLKKNSMYAAELILYAEKMTEAERNRITDEADTATPDQIDLSVQQTSVEDTLP